jgi:hypothetical protein
MTTPPQRRVLRHLDAAGGRVAVGATRDPQWNDATAAAKHARDLAAVVRDEAGLDRGIREVGELLDRMAEVGLVERSTAPDGASLVLTGLGREALEDDDV